MSIPRQAAHSYNRWPAPSPTRSARSGSEFVQRNPALLVGLTAVGAILCAIWTFLPWITISESDVTQSTDGTHEFPDCLEACSSAPVSTWGLLLAVVAALTAVGCFIWLFTHDRALVHAVALGPPVIFALTFVDVSALDGNAQRVTEADSLFQDTFDITVGPGWIFTALTSATICILSLIAVYRTRDVVGSPGSVQIGPLPVVGPPWDDLNEHKHYLYRYMQFTLPQSPCRVQRSLGDQWSATAAATVAAHSAGLADEVSTVTS